MSTIVDKWLTVHESDRDVKTGVLLRNGDWIDIHATGSIWAGVWFTGENGPEGWRDWSAPDTSPLPGSPPFSLLGKTVTDGYFYIGAGLNQVYLNKSTGSQETELYLRINDETPANGSGAFNVRIQVRRFDN